MRNPHAQRLEDERLSILREKISIGKALELAPLRMDATDLSRFRREASIRLNGLQREYEKVCYALGRSPSIAAVKIPSVEVSRAETAAIRARTARPATRTVPNYICKVMVRGK